MRIIAGKFKGRIIEMPKDIRPTSDKVREALFEILKDVIVGSNVLDLYCGSGAVGIEAHSRGAESVTFVDNNIKCISALKRNLSLLGILGLYNIKIYKMDALKSLSILNKDRRNFDIIFLDPPYYKDAAKNTLLALSNYDILTRNAFVIAEIYKKDLLPVEIGPLKKTKTYNYGDTKLEFYKI